MGFIEESLDKEKNYRTFTFSNGKDEERKKIEVPLDDLLMIFKGFRPRSMDLEVFKQISRLLQRESKQYQAGKIVHLSKVTDEVWAEYTKGRKVKQRGVTYVKKQEDDRTKI
jgi:hypothetical protein